MPDSEILPDLMQALTDAGSHGRHLYMLADFAGLPDPQAALGTWVDQGLCLIDRNADVSVRNVSPILIELVPTLHGESRLQRSVRAAEHYPVISWIESRLPAASLAMALQARLDAVLPDGDEVLLAFYDPRILPNLLAVLDELVRTAFCSIVSRWWYPDRSGQLVCLMGDGGHTDRLVAPLGLNAAQQNALIQAAEPDAVWHLLREQNSDALDHIAPAHRYAWLVGQVDRARGYRVEDIPALASYCLLALEHGDAFDEQEPWRAWLADVQTGRTGFVDLLNRASAAT
jgi:hypothetical protein